MIDKRLFEKEGRYTNNKQCYTKQITGNILIGTKMQSSHRLTLLNIVNASDSRIHMTFTHAILVIKTYYKKS